MQVSNTLIATMNERVITITTTSDLIRELGYKEEVVIVSCG